MATETSYRAVKLGKFDVHTRPHPDGSMYVYTPAPLGDYPDRLTDRLLYWAEHAPDRCYIARRDDQQQWQRISYAQALSYARHIGQGLLDRGLSPERPLAILSGNELEHALLALGAQYVGIPYASISPAYSIVSKDYEKLRHVLEVLTPGLVFASDARQYEAAVRATVPADVEFMTVKGDVSDRKSSRFDSLL